MSFMAIGSFVSAALFPIINTWMIDMWSWQVTWKVWGTVLLLFFVPIAFFGVRNRPEDMGLLPDGLEKSDVHTQTDISVKLPVLPEEEDWTLKQAMRTKAFWLLLICVGIPAMVNTGVTFHLLSIFGQNHLSPHIAATVLSLMAVFGFPVSFASGFILEKVKTNLLLGLVFIIEIVFTSSASNKRNNNSNCFWNCLGNSKWFRTNYLKYCLVQLFWASLYRKHQRNCNGRDGNWFSSRSITIRGRVRSIP